MNRRTLLAPPRPAGRRASAPLGLWSASPPGRATSTTTGPPRDHFDGVRFFSPGPAAGQGPRRIPALAARRRAQGLAGDASRARSATRRRPPVERPARRARRPRDAPDPGRRAQHPDRSGLRRAREPGRPSPGRGGSTRRASPSRTCRAIDAVLVTHNHYDHLDVATLARLWHRDRPRIVAPLGNDAIIRARATPDDRGRDPRLGRGGRSRPRRHRPSRAGLPLVGARPERPPHGAVVRLCADDAGGRDLPCRRHGLRRRPDLPRGAASASARPASRSCRSAPTSRAGSCSRST